MDLVFYVVATTMPPEYVYDFERLTRRVGTLLPAIG